MKTLNKILLFILFLWKFDCFATKRTFNSIVIISANEFDLIKSRHFSFQQKYSDNVTVYIDILSCKSSLKWLMDMVKLSRYPTDSVTIKVVYLNDVVAINSYDVKDEVLECYRLFCETFFYFEKVEDDNELMLKPFWNRNGNIPGIIHYWRSYDICTKEYYTFANELAMKPKWEQLKKVDDFLKPTYIAWWNTDAPADWVVDIEEFSVSSICTLSNITCVNIDRDQQQKLQLQSNGSSFLKLQLLQSNKIDISVNMVPADDAPWEIEYSPAVLSDHLSFSIRRHWTQDKKEMFTKSFTYGIWVLILVVIFVMFAFLLCRAFCKSMTRNNYEIENGRYFEIFFGFVVTLLEQGHKVVSHTEIYIIFGFWWPVVIHLTTAYKSKLVENLVKPSPVKVPTNFKELLYQSDYRIGIYKGRSVGDAILEMDEQKMKDLRARNGESHWGSSECMGEALIDHFACVSMANSQNFIGIGVIAALGLKSNVEEFWQFSQQEELFYFTWAFRKGFPLKVKVINALGRIEQSGLRKRWLSWILVNFKRNGYKIDRIIKKNIKTKEFERFVKYFGQLKLPDDINLKSDYIRLKHLEPIFYAFFIELTVTLVVFISENLYHLYLKYILNAVKRADRNEITLKKLIRFEYQV